MLAGKGFGKASEQVPQPEVAAAAVPSSGGSLGTIFKRGDEEIRELTSDEYLYMMRDWAPLANFAQLEVEDSAIKAQAKRALAVLRGMQKWAPARKGDFRQEGSGWAFAAPVAAFKAGNLDAVACLEVTEEDGITIAWLCENPSYLGVPGNSIAWLVKGIETLVGKRLDMAVQELPTARGELADDDEPQASPKK